MLLSTCVCHIETPSFTAYIGGMGKIHIYWQGPSKYPIQIQTNDMNTEIASQQVIYWHVIRIHDYVRVCVCVCVFVCMCARTRLFVCSAFGRVTSG